MPYKDKEKQKKAQHESYLKNKEDYGKRKYSLTISRRGEIKEWLQEYKSTLKCEKCPENHPATLDFHHVNSEEKKNKVSALVVEGYSIKTIKEEIDKCIVLCANCHRKLHYEKTINT